MKRTTKTLIVLALAALIASPAFAADEKKKKKEAGAKKGPDAVAMLLKKVELTDEQAKQVEALKAKFNPKLAECRKQMASVVTPEQRKARAEALKAAKADGKKGKELKAAVDAAVSLSGEQQEKLAKCQSDMKALSGEIRTALLSVLTEEQIKTAGLKKGGEKKAKKPAGEKKKKAA